MPNFLNISWKSNPSARLFEVGSRESFLESYDRLLRVEVIGEYKKINLDLLKTHYLRQNSARRLVEAIENVKI